MDCRFLKTTNNFPCINKFTDSLNIIMSNPFPSHSLDNRLTQIDLTSQELSKQLEGYTQLQELVENIPNLLKVEQSLKTFQKKTKELEAKLKDNKSLIT